LRSDYSHGRWGTFLGTRADRALARIEHALASRKPAAPARDEEFRAKVREVVEELDELIREAAA
jgi:hypothetical protein